MTSQESPYDVVILGAGSTSPHRGISLTKVLGLATADALTSAGARVAVLARDLPEDLDSGAFASPWAGANWSSFATNDAERRRDTITFQRFGELAKSHPSMIRPTPFVLAWDEDAGYANPWYKELVGNFRTLPHSEVPKPFAHAVAFDSFTLNPPRLLAYLAGRLRDAGVPIVRRRVASLDEAFNAFGPVDLVVNATGLGAKSLLGVEDPAVYPVRGQTVLVRAPGVLTCYGVRDKKLPPGEAVYVIPRPGSDGCVVLGGTTLKDDYSLLPRRETAERILQNAHRVCPQLAPGGTWKDIEIVAHNVGLRPWRDGGLRLEIEERAVGDGALTPAAGRAPGRRAAVLHCYGIGPAGYQASFGIASEARDIVLQYLANKKAKL